MPVVWLMNWPAQHSRHALFSVDLPDSREKTFLEQMTTWVMERS
jgi:hypothetical protein